MVDLVVQTLRAHPLHEQLHVGVRADQLRGRGCELAGDADDRDLRVGLDGCLSRRVGQSGEDPVERFHRHARHPTLVNPGFFITLSELCGSRTSSRPSHIEVRERLAQQGLRALGCVTPCPKPSGAAGSRVRGPHSVFRAIGVQGSTSNPRAR